MRLRASLIAGLLGLMLCSATFSSTAPALTADPADRRGEEQTFLTFPEWFLVFSPAEYAHYVRDHTPDGFCFWAHIGQFWSAYGGVIHETTARHEKTNWGYHLMIVVIGVSTTIEYAARSAYETLIGRISATLSGGDTAEDRYGARAAQEYVDFIRVRPWYEFDFRARLRGLWRDTTLVGPHMLRKWERKYALSTEYIVKGSYAWLITRATHDIYDTPLETTSVVVDHWTGSCLPPNSRVLRRAGASEALLAIPRYAPFTPAASTLARCGAHFEEIAGNRSVILISVVGPLGKSSPLGLSAMTRQPIVTEPGLERQVLVVPIPRLSTLLRELGNDGFALEHVFDF